MISKIFTFVFLMSFPFFLNGQDCNDCNCLLKNANKQFKNPNLDTLIVLSNGLAEFKCSGEQNNLYGAILLGAFKQLLDNNPKQAKVIKERLPIDAFWIYNDSVAIIVDDKNKFGFVDKNLRTVIPCQYDKAQNFIIDSKGFAKVVKNGKNYFLDISKKEYLVCNDLKNLS